MAPHWRDVSVKKARNSQKQKARRLWNQENLPEDIEENVNRFLTPSER